MPLFITNMEVRLCVHDTCVWQVTHLAIGNLFVYFNTYRFRFQTVIWGVFPLGTRVVILYMGVLLIEEILKFLGFFYSMALFILGISLKGLMFSILNCW
jgi:hypothetical protein